MNAWRRSELRQCLRFARACRGAIGIGEIARAFRFHLLAVRSLNLARSFGGACAVTATARLSRAVADLGDRLEDALRPPPAVEAYELVPGIFESLKVLQTEGVDVEDDTLLARARNTATALLGLWEFTAIRDENPSQDGVSTSPTNGDVVVN